MLIDLNAFTNNKWNTIGPGTIVVLNGYEYIKVDDGSGDETCCVQMQTGILTSISKMISQDEGALIFVKHWVQHRDYKYDRIRMNEVFDNSNWDQS